MRGAARCAGLRALLPWTWAGDGGRSQPSQGHSLQAGRSGVCPGMIGFRHGSGTALGAAEEAAESDQCVFNTEIHWDALCLGAGP